MDPEGEERRASPRAWASRFSQPRSAGRWPVPRGAPRWLPSDGRGRSGPLTPSPSRVGAGPRAECATLAAPSPSRITHGRQAQDPAGMCFLLSRDWLTAVWQRCYLLFSWNRSWVLRIGRFLSFPGCILRVLTVSIFFCLFPTLKGHCGLSKELRLWVYLNF